MPGAPNTQAVAVALATGDEENLPVGGFEKKYRTNRWSDERPGKNKKPRRQKPLEETRASVVILPTVSAVNPPEKKEEVNEMNSQNSGNTQTAPVAPRFEICPICGFFSKLANKTTEDGEKIRFLVCKGCNDEYAAYATNVAKVIISGKKDIATLSKTEWVLSQIDLTRFEKELEEARQKRVGIHERAIKSAQADRAGKSTPREVFISLVTQYEKKEGDELYFLVKRLFARLEAAKKLKPELEQMLAQKAAQALVTNPAETIAAGTAATAAP